MPAIINPYAFGAASLSLTTPAVLTLTDGFGSPTLSGGNLTVTGSSFRIRANILNSTGKFYWEVTYTSLGSSSGTIGITEQTGATTWGDGSSAITYRATTGAVTKDDDTAITTLGTTASGGTVGLAADLAAHLLWLKVGGVWSGDPEAGTGGISISALSGSLAPLLSSNASTLTATANFGASAFVSPVPSGFYPGFGTP